MYPRPNAEQLVQIGSIHLTFDHTKVSSGRWQTIQSMIFLAGQSSAVVHRILVKKPGSTFVENTHTYVHLYNIYTDMLFIYTTLYVYKYIYRYVYVITSCYTSYEGNCPKQGSSLLTWGWPPLVLLQSSMCNFQACIFVAAGWASTSWCFDFAYFTMGLDSLHPSISHNLWVGFLCSYSLFWEISFLFETMQTNPPDNLIDTFEICNGTHENLTSFSVYFVTRSSVRSTKYPKSPKSPMLVGYAPFSQYNPVQ